MQLLVYAFPQSWPLAEWDGCDCKIKVPWFLYPEHIEHAGDASEAARGAYRGWRIVAWCGL